MNLLRWNARINLTAVKDDNEIIHKHFLDSLSVLEYITLRDGDAVIDVGAGCGISRDYAKNLCPWDPINAY